MKKLVVLAATLLALSGAWAQAVKVDSSIKGYTKTTGVSGNLNSIGSDTLNNVMTLWTEAFQKQYPNVKIQVEGKGSTTAPPALIAGTAQLGPMSRLMKPEESDAFEKQYGYKPTPVRVAVDGIGVFVNKDNPLQQLTMAQVDAIFSKTRKSGAPEDITTWGQVGLSGEWGTKPISLYGRNSASGTYGYFKEHALVKGDYKDTVKEQPGSAAVVQGITADKFAIGYSGVGYKTSDVKTVKLAAKEGGEYIADDAENVYSGRYPLSRFLYIYVNKAPGKPLSPLVREFLAFVLSKEGQEIVIKDGYLPLLGQHVGEELPKLK
ncbi:MAG TPA: phosphate ABC transporter substrate-binding protein PstS family protein [Candidatus Polarisedimenticolaceae bacterium]|nr:phosphate ABC transporter substrate-binding protein PstS family protein [Candidatus Polarisedimenticolaceae bacterium]